MAQVKKISPATIFGKIPLEALLEAHKKGQTLPVMRVMGSAVASKTGTSSYGDWTCLLGTFEAIHAGDGSVHRASQFYPPEIALIPILTALAQPDCRGVEFVIDLAARYADSGKPGGSVYEWTYENVLPPDANDPITRLATLVEKAGGREFGILKAITMPVLEHVSVSAQAVPPPAADAAVHGLPPARGRGK